MQFAAKTVRDSERCHKTRSQSISSTSSASKAKSLQLHSLPRPDALSFNIVIGSGVESGKAKHLSSDTAITIVETQYLSAPGRWQLAFDLFNMMASQNERPNVRTFNAAIAVCASASKWQHALSLHQDMDGESVGGVGKGDGVGAATP